MHRVQFITHSTPRYDYLAGVELALKGGCRWIQLRMKGASAEQILSVARDVKTRCEHYGAKFIIDDHVELVISAGADGVHLGKNDMPVTEARQILGKDKIIGATANTLEDVLRGFHSGADYIGCGPYRFTRTKENLSPIIGLEGYLEIMRQAREQGVSIPIVAIGGVGLPDIEPLMGVGVDGVALSGSVLRADAPIQEMQAIVEMVKRYDKR